MKKNILNSTIVATLSLFLIGCGGEPETPKEKPLEGDPAVGQTVFESNCVACHQKDGKGKSGFAPSINNIDFLQVANDQQIKRFIMEGRPGTTMAPFKDNPDVSKNIDDLVVYIRSWKDHFELYKEVDVDKGWVSKGDVAKGEVVYKTFCAACHGQEGEGYAAGGSGTAIGKPGFLKIAPDGYIKATMLYGRAGTAMKSFDKSKGLANLDEEDMDNVIAYLRSKGAYETPVVKADIPPPPRSSYDQGLLWVIYGFLGFVLVALLFILAVFILMRRSKTI